LNYKKTTLKFLLVFSFLGILLIPNVSTIDAPPKSSAITISFWYTENDAEKPGIVQLVDEFEILYPGVSVEALQIDFFNARNQYTSSYIAKAESDVMRATRDWIPEFAAAGMIHPLTNTFNASDLDDFLDIAIEMVSLSDSEGDVQIWAYPQLVDTPAIMYNKEIFELAGIDTSLLTINTSWTWDEYWDILLQVNGTEYEFGGETQTVYSTSLAGMMFGAQPYYFGMGAEMFYNDEVYINTAAIDSAESRAALEYLKMITDSSVTPDWLDQGWGPLNPSFRSGQVAMINQGPWELKQNIEIEPIFQGGDNLGIVQLPHDDEGNRGAPVGCHGFIISSHMDLESQEYEAAVNFSRFMSSPHAQKLGAIDFYHVPSRSSVMELPEVQAATSYEYVKAYWDAVEVAFRVPVSKDWAEIETDFGDRVNEYLAGELTLDECIAQTLVLWAEYMPTKDIDPTDDTTDDSTDDTSVTDDASVTDDTIISDKVIWAYPVITLVGVFSLSALLLLRKYGR